MSTSDFNKKYLEVLSFEEEHNALLQPIKIADRKLLEKLKQSLEKGHAKVKIDYDKISQRHADVNWVEYDIDATINNIAGRITIAMHYSYPNTITVFFTVGDTESTIDLDDHLGMYGKLINLIEYFKKYAYNDLLDDVIFVGKFHNDFGFVDKDFLRFKISNVNICFDVFYKNTDNIDGTRVYFSGFYKNPDCMFTINDNHGVASVTKVNDQPVEEWIEGSFLKEILLSIMIHAAQSKLKN